MRQKAGGAEQFWQGKTADAFADALTRWSQVTLGMADDIDALASDIFNAGAAIAAEQLARIWELQQAPIQQSPTVSPGAVAIVKSGVNAVVQPAQIKAKGGLK
jgi:hypothetical protein